MRKAKKKLHRMPKLSFIDQVVYWLGLLLLSAVYFAMALIPLLFRDRISFADPAVIAVSENASVMWVLLPCLTFFLITFIPWSVFYNDRRPIFGLKDFKYGPPAWPRVYPLFMRNKAYVWISEKKQKEKRQTILILVILLLISLIPFPWSLYGRDCLMVDGRIRQYSMFNRQKEEFSPQEIESVEFSVYKYSTGKYNRTTHWDVQVTLTTDSGREYSFQARDFRRDRGSFSWLKDMMQLKTQFDASIIHYSRTDNLKNVVWDYDLSDAEEVLLYQLFGLNPELCTERKVSCTARF